MCFAVLCWDCRILSLLFTLFWNNFSALFLLETEFPVMKFQQWHSCGLLLLFVEYASWNILGLVMGCNGTERFLLSQQLRSAPGGRLLRFELKKLRVAWMLFSQLCWWDGDLWQRGGDKRVWLNESVIAKTGLLFAPYLGLGVNSCYLSTCCYVCYLQTTSQKCFCLKEELEILYRIVEDGKDEGHPGFLRMESHHFALPGWLLVRLFEGAMKIVQ